MSETLRPATLDVIDDNGSEVTIRQEEYWLYDADALPGWITPQEHAEREGLGNIIDIREAQTEFERGEQS